MIYFNQITYNFKIKTMKKLLALILMAVTIFGCGYDDDDLWKKVGDLDSRLEIVEGQLNQLNSDLGSIKTIVDALANDGVITGVEETTNGWKITLSNGKSFEVKNGAKGEDGKNAPVIGVKEHTDGEYYWTITIDGTEKWLPDNDTPQLRVTGHTPVLDVDADGYWTVDGARLQTPGGNYIQAEGKDGDSFFENVDFGNEDEVIFKLKNGTVFSVPVASYITFEGANETAVIRFSSTKSFKIKSKSIEFAEVLSVPEGWSATVDLTENTVSITAPNVDGIREGVVSIIALDNKGNTLMAAKRIRMIDYTDPDGVFLLNEGNSFSQDGTIIWYDGDLTEFRSIYEEANSQKTPGNTLQDMFISDGKIYLVCQNGNSMGGDGKLLICDARTMVLQKAYNSLDFERHETHPGCPQHIVVANNKVFIQYVDNGLENNSGIRVFDLATETLSTTDITGTYGAFGTVGALKAKMLYSRGQIIAGLAKAVVFIDPATEAITKRIDFTGGVKDIVKGADGNLYIAVSGDFETPQGFYDPSPEGSRIYAYTQSGEKLSETPVNGVQFNTSTAYPNIGMSASFREPYLYFNADKDMMASDYTSRFDYTTKTTVPKYVTPQNYSYVYGYTGAHPTRSLLFVAGNPNYQWTRMTVYDTTQPDSPAKVWDSNRDYRNFTASPAGVYFSYSFSNEYLAK